MLRNHSQYPTHVLLSRQSQEEIFVDQILETKNDDFIDDKVCLGQLDDEAQVVGDEAEVRVTDFGRTIWLFNTKQWYESLNKSEVLFQVGNTSSSNCNFESASSPQKRLISDSKNMDTIKVVNLKQKLQTSIMPTSETK